MTNYLDKIKAENIKIKKQKDIMNLINDYGYHRIINCYGDLIKHLPKRYYNTKNIAKLFKVDKELSKLIIYYLLDFEQKLNARSIAAVVSVLGKGNDDYILNLNEINLEGVKNKSQFIDELYASAKGCNCLMMFDNARSIPLNKLCLSWSFHTLISFISVQNLIIKESIARKFNINKENIGNFISTCHSIRKFRNTISHNDIFFITTLNYYRREFNATLNHLKKSKISLEKDITIFSLVEMLELILNVDIKKDIYEILNDAKLNKKIKRIVLDYMDFN